MADFSQSPAFLPISRVTIWYDDENAFTAGDDTGRTLELDCPWATQAMANAALEKVKGYEYKPFQATDALLPTSAIVGDAVTANNVYSVIATKETVYNALSPSNISAPEDEEIDHEFPYLSKQVRESKRTVKLGQYYYGARITRKEGLVIEKTYGQDVSAKAVLNADEFSFYAGSERVLYFDPATQTYKFTGELNVGDNFIVDKEGNVEISGNLAIPNGSIQFKNLDSITQSTINTASANAANANLNASSALSGLQLMGNGQYQGGSFINGKNIYAPNLYGDTITLLDGSSRQVGTFSLQHSASYALDIYSNLSLRMQAAQGNNVYLSNGSAFLQMLGNGTLTLSGSAIVLSASNFGNYLPSSGQYGQLFFKLA